MSSHSKKIELGVEFAVALLIFLYPFGAEQMSLPHNFWVGVSCWIAGTAILIRAFWAAPWAVRLTRLEKSLISFIVCAGFVALFYRPIYKAYVRPTQVGISVTQDSKRDNPPVEQMPNENPEAEPQTKPIPAAKPRKQNLALKTRVLPPDTGTTSEPQRSSASQNCPNGICIGGDNNGSATVNNLTTRPDPSFTWKQEVGQSWNGKATVRLLIRVAGLMDVPAFAAACDKACDSVGASVEGASQPEFYDITGRSDAVAFSFIVPTTIVAGSVITWDIESVDGTPVQIKTIERVAPEKLPVLPEHPKSHVPR